MPAPIRAPRAASRRRGSRPRRRAGAGPRRAGGARSRDVPCCQQRHQDLAGVVQRVKEVRDLHGVLETEPAQVGQPFGPVDREHDLPSRPHSASQRLAAQERVELVDGAQPYPSSEVWGARPPRVLPTGALAGWPPDSWSHQKVNLPRVPKWRARHPLRVCASVRKTVQVCAYKHDIQPLSPSRSPPVPPSRRHRA